MDAVIHFAAIAYVGESMADPNRYYHNITSNTVSLLETMKQFGVRRLVYSSTCATYGNPDVLPITEKTPTVPINPYGKAKLYAETAIRDYARVRPVVRRRSSATSTSSGATPRDASASSRDRSCATTDASAARVSTPLSV